MIGRGRRPGRYRPTVMAAAAATAGAALLVSGCAGGGDDRAAGQSDATAAVTEEGIPPPPGHVGLWFGTEPWGPLDHLVWASQRYIGDPVAVPPVGDRAKGPEARDLPDVCDQRVVDRMVELGLRAGADPAVGYGLIQCSVFGSPENPDTRPIGFFWGSRGSISDLSYNGEVISSNNRYFEAVKDGVLTEDFGCVVAHRQKSSRHAIFSYSDGSSDYRSCEDIKKTTQVVVNVLGGDNVQV